MNGSRPGRYRESAAVTAPTNIYNEHNTSFVEEHALDAIAKEVCLYLFLSLIHLIFSLRLKFVFIINANKTVKHVNYETKN
jgi:uncharacterized membrane protein YagU involved in acid resistance